MNQYKYGRKKEKRVAKQLRRKGYKTIVHKGSRGASDIEATKGSRKLVIQVKATRKKQAPCISTNGIRRLKIQARKKNSTPVVAEVTRGKIRYKSARTKRKLIV